MAGDNDEVVLEGDSYPLGASPLLITGDDNLDVHGTPGQPRPSIDSTGNTITVTGSATGLRMRGLQISTRNDAGGTALQTVAGGTFDDLLLSARGPTDTQGDARAFLTSAAATLTNSTVTVRKDNTDQDFHSVVSGGATGGVLTLRNVTINRLDANAGAALAAITGPSAAIDAQNVAISIPGTVGVLAFGAPSTLLDVTITHPGGVSGTIGLSLAAPGRVAERVTVDTPNMPPISVDGAGVRVEDFFARGIGGGGGTVRLGGDNFILRRGFAIGTATATGVSSSPGLISDVGAVNTNPLGGAALDVNDSQVQLRNFTGVAPGTNAVGIDLDFDGSATSITAKNVIAVGGALDVRANVGATANLSFSIFDTTGGGGSFTSGPGNIAANPPLADPAAGDFHLLASSPAIDTGTSDVLNGPLDFEGNPRTVGAAPDIGADEFVPAPPGGSPPVAGPGLGPGLGVDNILPAVQRFLATNTVFAPRGVRARAAGRRRVPRGTRFRYRLSKPAAVTIAIARRGAGRRVGRRCLPATRARRRRPRCTRFVAVGSLRAPNARLRDNSLAFSGRLRGRPLRVARYRATIRATDGAGNRARPRSLAFRIVRP